MSDAGGLVLGDVIREVGNAVVHDALWRGRQVCVKVARDAADPAASDLRAEAVALAHVTHPALLAVLDAGTLADGRAYLVVPALRGEDLRERLMRGPLAPREAFAIADVIAGALTALHSAGFLHRDIKPENVFLSDAGPRLIDLGLASALEATPSSGRVRGTYDHVAPERLFGEQASVATEVYELAALVWQMLSGSLPWPSAAGPAARRGIPRLAVAGPVGVALDTALRSALSTVPDRRPASIAALISALAAALEATNDTPRPRRTMARHAAPSAPAGVGRVLGDTYRLLRVIGSGGSGTVYEAEHLRLPRRFAIKVLQPGRDDVDALARFRREAEVVAALSHPHIIEVFDYDIDDTGLPFMVMPLLDGEPLSERLRMGALAPADAAAVVTQMANAITAAHAGGVVHRDLKPSNVFLNQRPDGAIDVTVLDFGISKVLAAHADRTATGMLLGTPGYAAPEQVRGEPSAIGPAADVFALAAIAYEVMTGRRAFDAGTCEAALYKVCHEQPDPMGSPAVDRAVAAGLAKRPEDRPESPERFAAAFAAAVMEAQRCPRRRVSIAARVIASTAAITAVVAVVGAVAPVTVSAPAAKPIAEPSLVSPPLGAGLPAPGRASPEATTVPVPAPVPANARVTLAIDAPGAHATLDGVAVAGTTLVVGPGHHELRITAPGREPVVRELDASHIGSTVVIQLPRRTAPHKSLRDLLER